MRIHGTEISADWGVLFHVMWGLLAAFLSYPYLFSGILVLKQSIDWLSGEDWPENSGDIAEYCSGLVAGLILKRFLLWWW